MVSLKISFEVARKFLSKVLHQSWIMLNIVIMRMTEWGIIAHFAPRTTFPPFCYGERFGSPFRIVTPMATNANMQSSNEILSWLGSQLSASKTLIYRSHSFFYRDWLRVDWECRIRSDIATFEGHHCTCYSMGCNESWSSAATTATSQRW
jgi:hypothetical protein